MAIKINYINKSIDKTSSNIALFVNEKFSTDNIKRFLTDQELSYINDLLKIADLKKIYLFMN